MRVPHPAGSQPRETRFADGRLVRTDPIVRRIVHQWRRLTGGGAPTLIACSGGCDSTALLVALASSGADVALGHVLHDMRDRALAEADRDAAFGLADRFGLPRIAREVRSGPGNIEGSLRRHRYAALADMASELACPWIATAHHADDQLETIIMALLRGSGPKGMRGMASKRRLFPGGPMLVRPMLGVTRAEAEDLCARAMIPWREDMTNQDTSRLRAAVRYEVLPELRRLRPSVPRLAARTASLMRGAAAIIDAHAITLSPERLEWPRERLRSERPIIIGEVLRRAYAHLTGGIGADRLSGRLLAPALRAIYDRSGEERTFEWPRGVSVRVTSCKVGVIKASRSRETMMASEPPKNTSGPS